MSHESAWPAGFSEILLELACLHAYACCDAGDNDEDSEEHDTDTDEVWPKPGSAAAAAALDDTLVQMKKRQQALSKEAHSTEKKHR